MKEEMAKMAAVAHMSAFVQEIGHSLRDFMEPLNPNESQEMHDYLLSVARAVDNVIAVACFATEDKEALAALEESTQKMIAQLSEMHKPEVTH